MLHKQGIVDVIYTIISTSCNYIMLSGESHPQ
jgi:hypothetical protein